MARRKSIAQIRRENAARRAAFQKRNRAAASRRAAQIAARNERLRRERIARASLVKPVSTITTKTVFTPGASQSALRRAAQRGQTAIVQQTAGRRGRGVLKQTQAVSTRRGRLSDLSNEDAIRELRRRRAEALKVRNARARNARLAKIQRQAAARNFSFATQKPKPVVRTRVRPTRPGFTRRTSFRTGRTVIRRSRRRRGRRR